MHIFLSRILYFLSSPWSYILALLVGAVLCKNKKTKYTLLSLSIIVLFLFTNNPLYNRAEKIWVNNIKLDIDSTAVYDYGIVEGGFALYDKGRDRIEFFEAADRLIDAVQLYRQGNIKKIVISGDGSIIASDSIGNPDTMIRYLKNMGVDRNDIIIEPNARNTKEHATCILSLLGDSIKSKKLLIITSANHISRSLYVFNASGIAADAYGVDIVTLPPKARWTDWIPDLNLPSKWYWLIHEWIGCIMYRIIL